MRIATDKRTVASTNVIDTPDVPRPTRELIETRTIVEDQHYEYKSEVDLDDRKAKCNFIDDVVAFLNAKPGHIIVGVKADKRGAYEAYVPMNGDQDPLRRRITSVIQDNIDPKPLAVQIEFIPVPVGFLIDVSIEENRRQPYQNKMNGAFYKRTGAQNTPIPRDQIYSYFIAFERYRADIANLSRREDDRAKAKAGGGPSFHLSILPREHYEERRPFNPTHGKQGRKYAPMLRYDDRPFAGCDGGVEATGIDSQGRMARRIFIGHDWFVHLFSLRTLTVAGHQRVTLYEFEQDLAKYMGELEGLLCGEEGLKGPFCMSLAMLNLRGSEELAWAFPNASDVTMCHGAIVDRITDPDLFRDFHALLQSSSVYA